MTKNATAIAAQAARGFDRLKCQECAEAIRAALCAAGHRGELIEIRASSKSDFMVCIRYDGGKRTITQNGRHLGVRVGDVVFDNLHPDGLQFDQWLKDFDAPYGMAVHSVVEF